MNKNQNKRFSMEKESDIKAWESLHSNEVGEKFKSQNRFVIEKINYYYERVCVCRKIHIWKQGKKKTLQYVSTEDMDAIEERIR